MNNLCKFLEKVGIMAAIVGAACTAICKANELKNNITGEK